MVSPLNCAAPWLPDQQTNATKNVFPLKYTPGFYSSGPWEWILKVDEKQMQYCFGNGLCWVDYVCYLVDTFNHTLQKLCFRILPTKPIFWVPEKFHLGFLLHWFCFMEKSQPHQYSSKMKSKSLTETWLSSSLLLSVIYLQASKQGELSFFAPNLRLQIKSWPKHVSSAWGVWVSECRKEPPQHKQKLQRECSVLLGKKHGKRDHRGQK